MIINVLTLFPEMIEPVVNSSIIGRAQSNGQLSIRLLNIRDFTLDKHKKTDDTPFGGGAGMVLSLEPVFNAFKSIGANDKRILYMSPKGRLLDQDIVFDLACEEELVILCGHYEGIDERIINYWNIEEISIGDYILTGGEIPALTLIDAVVRMLPEVLGSPESHNEESIYSGLLEYPHYTKPRSYNGLDVPEVLVSGNHKLIHLWQFEQSLIITKQRRPDLFEKFCADRMHER
jgi:tRNA (guanine37-N1)-methyltransferase